MKIFVFIIGMLCASVFEISAQEREYRGKVVDKFTGEPVVGASLSINNLNKARTDASGAFKIKVSVNDTLSISCAGFKKCCLPAGDVNAVVYMEQDSQSLQEVVVTAGRMAEKRREAPVAISSINAQVIRETKPTSIDQVLNKASGVFMVNLGNEQHQMSIRQPMTTKSLFLYLEDGIPVRTTGLFNHNTLLEINMAATKQIEVIKGPASSMYGAEAIGGAVNVITLSSPAHSLGHVSIQANTNGYKRTDIQYGNTVAKFGFLLSGYYANSTNSRLEHSDFSKTAVTLKTNYNIGKKANWINSISYSDYYSDMFGALDSSNFARKDFSSLYNFTYRKVESFRVKSQLNFQWIRDGDTKASVIYRNNSIQQNPSYKIRNDYRRISDGSFRGNPLKAHGEISTSSFSTYALFVQHDQKLEKIKSKLSVGASMDVSPSHFVATYIKIDKNSNGSFTGYSQSDSSLSRYSTGISNFASYLNFNIDVIEGLKLVTALRYDYYHFNYVNKLSSNSFSGAPSAMQHFNRLTPKLGITYNHKNVGLYANYSQGFVPPQISELYQGVKVPYLLPQTYFNYEIGGWLELLGSKLYADWSVYRLMGKNEIISVLTDDGTTQNRNAGKTSHTGLEYGVNYKASAAWKFRFSATSARHQFVDFKEKGVSYDGNRMALAPVFVANMEASFKPVFLKGFRTSLEVQHQGKYWMDNANTRAYKGFDVVNVRTGYQMKRFEVWLNVLNATNTYYSVAASKSSSTYNYNLGEPLTFNTGVTFHLNKQK